MPQSRQFVFGLARRAPHRGDDRSVTRERELVARDEAEAAVAGEVLRIARLEGGKDVARYVPSTEDEVEHAEKELQKLTDDYIGKIDAMIQSVRAVSSLPAPGTWLQYWARPSALT